MDSKASDQTGRMPRLIWVFAGRTCHFVGFVMPQLNYYSLFKLPYFTMYYTHFFNPISVLKGLICSKLNRIIVKQQFILFYKIWGPHCTQHYLCLRFFALLNQVCVRQIRSQFVKSDGKKKSVSWKPKPNWKWSTDFFSQLFFYHHLFSFLSSLLPRSTKYKVCNI